MRPPSSPAAIPRIRWLARIRWLFRIRWLSRIAQLVSVQRARRALGLGLIAAALADAGAGAAEEPWARLRPLRGEAQSALVQVGETLHDIALAHRVGFDALTRLNPELDPWIPPPGTVVELPTRFVLPAVDERGLVINLPEMRLYDFTDPTELHVYPIAIGDAADPSPLGRFEIGEKRTEPAWRVPESIRREKPWLEELVPPGPDNPLGSYWMTLGRSSYGIHGTNVRWSIGRIATHGCIRLYEDQMAELYARVPPGAPVEIVYERFKWGTDGRRLFLEAHPDPYGRTRDRLAEALALPRQLGLLTWIDVEVAWRTIDALRGVPVEVGLLPGASASSDD